MHLRRGACFFICPAGLLGQAVSLLLGCNLSYSLRTAALLFGLALRSPIRGNAGFFFSAVARLLCLALCFLLGGDARLLLGPLAYLIGLALPLGHSARCVLDTAPLSPPLPGLLAPMGVEAGREPSDGIRSTGRPVGPKAAIASSKASIVGKRALGSFSSALITAATSGSGTSA